MINRRSFFNRTKIFLISLFLPMPLKKRLFANKENKLLKKNPESALILWFSQTGHTQLYGKLIAKILQSKGLEVRAHNIRDFDKKIINEFDIIVFGSPVYYLDIAEPLRKWMEIMPEIKGIPVASYSTFGGPGHNQYNTACNILELAEDKGGIPVGMSFFGNMSTYAPTWSIGNTERILKYSHLPNEVTYTNVRSFSNRILENVKKGISLEIDHEFSLFDILKPFSSAWTTKLMITDHRIDPEKCIQCGTCVKVCPAGAIDLDTNKVDTGACIACMGCVNNCPVQAVHMKFMGSNVYGFNKFLKDSNVEITGPEELQEK